MHTSVKQALAVLNDSTETAEILFRHGNLLVEIYKPEQIDNQSPHTRDEIYVIASGSGEFINGDTQHAFDVGDVIFVKAGVEHCFINFTDDFSTWVFFYGPKGGEVEVEGESIG